MYHGSQGRIKILSAYILTPEPAHTYLKPGRVIHVLERLFKKALTDGHSVVI